MAGAAPLERAGQPAGLVAAIAASWRDLRGGARRRLAQRPSEAGLLAHAYLAAGLAFVAGLPQAVADARALDQPDALAGVLAGRLFAALFLFPLLLYALAAAQRLVARGFGGRGSFYSARVTLFWTVIVALPLVLAEGLVSALVPALPPRGGALLGAAASALAGLGFVWIWATMTAEAEGFGRRGLVLAVFLIILVASLALLRVIPSIA
ncbi:YIP1 family protein [Rhodobacteraceae bacterium 2CG4]|uniref:YIP1 family protein n=1 Tax=Halovulum marinum TaxID=2662447 RepID=A0A6L5Z0X0_9RHOB|nr:YIP1 family protein [Halovulum marinum]MSU89959.1 YIP1 family protein [Halovulum marinum]